MVKRVVMVYKFGKMGVYMKDLGRKEKHLAKEECCSLTVIII